MAPNMPLGVCRWHSITSSATAPWLRHRALLWAQCRVHTIALLQAHLGGARQPYRRYGMTRPGILTPLLFLLPLCSLHYVVV